MTHLGMVEPTRMRKLDYALKQLELPQSLNEIQQILSVTIFEKTPLFSTFFENINKKHIYHNLTNDYYSTYDLSLVIKGKLLPEEPCRIQPIL